MTIYSRYDTSGAGSFGFFVGEYGSANTKLVVSTNDGTQTDHVSTGDVPVGTWTYVSAVYDGTIV